MAPTPKEIVRAAIARTFGIRNALAAIEIAREEGIGPALAIAMLEQESGGKNVWGHDPTIFIGGWDAKNKRYWTNDPDRKGYVNQRGYEEYRAQRRQSGNRKMQGVGPMQLTWWEFQDGADRLGGAWKVGPNLRYGFRRLKKLQEEHGFEKGIERYNGTGPKAVIYRQRVLDKLSKWRRRFGIRA